MSATVNELYGTYRTSCVRPYHGHSCRTCANCLSASAQQWNTRLQHEAMMSDLSIACCLTYTEKMLQDPRIGASYYEWEEYNGEQIHVYKYKWGHYRNLYKIATVSKTDVQKFIKRLRKYLPKGITLRYYVNAQYGDQFHRPHYHCLLFFNGDEYLSYNRYEFEGYVLRAWFDGIEKRYKVDSLDYQRNMGKKIGENPIVEFDEVDEDSIRYTTRYTARESLIGTLACEISPEFTLKSQSLGKSFFLPQLDAKRSLLHALCREFVYYKSPVLPLPVDLRSKWARVLGVPRSARIAQTCNIKDDTDFCHRLERAVTFYNNLGSEVFLPYFITTQYFRGYFYYPPKTFDYYSVKESRYKRTKPIIADPVWITKNPSTSRLDEVVRCMFTQMLDYYIHVKAVDFLGCDFDKMTVFYETELSDSVLGEIIGKKRNDFQSMRNRIEGAYKHRERKRQEKQAYVTKMAKRFNCSACSNNQNVTLKNYHHGKTKNFSQARPGQVEQCRRSHTQPRQDVSK